MSNPKATTESGPQVYQQGQSMSDDLTTLLRDGAKHGRYPMWPTAPTFHMTNDPVATLEVGNEVTGVYNFYIHESIICRLDFFRIALQGGFKEASTKLIKMPEDDPLFMACLVEFLYTGSYKEPEFTGGNGGGADYRDIFMRELFHARVLALGEKYGCQALCANAAHNIKWSGDISEYPAAHHAHRLEYLVQLYEISGPGSALRIANINDHGRSFGRVPHVWDVSLAAYWIGDLWRDPVRRPLVEEAAERCPDLGEDIEMMRARNFFGRPH